MSLIGNLLSGLFDSSSSETTSNAELPCSNCPSGCTLAPDACSVCEPYKKELLDVLYYVDDIDAFRAKYEVVGTSSSTGTYTCPFCGAPSANPFVCDYCGSTIKEGNGKIQVARASDIPNPILEAQNIIFERYEKIVDGYDDDESSGGLLGAISFLFTGSTDSKAAGSLGDKMTEDEIKEAARLYGVSVSGYLQGLDNGKYKTLSAKKAENTYSSFSGAGSTAAGAGLGLGALGALGIFGHQYNTSQSFNPHQRPGNTFYYGNNMFSSGFSHQNTHQSQFGPGPGGQNPFGMNNRPGSQSTSGTHRPGEGVRPGTQNNAGVNNRPGSQNTSGTHRPGSSGSQNRPGSGKGGNRRSK
ncbi:MAG: hypothetical protein K5637_08240 [Lachnospiraceae bacterium]|nr:hypothetical protein [Lachnospiraceae bacterium]